MSKYVSVLSSTSFFALWWLLILGEVEGNLAGISLLLFGILAILSGLPGSPAKPPSGGNGRGHVRRRK